MTKSVLSSGKPARKDSVRTPSDGLLNRLWPKWYDVKTLRRLHRYGGAWDSVLGPGAVRQWLVRSLWHVINLGRAKTGERDYAQFVGYAVGVKDFAAMVGATELRVRARNLIKAWKSGEAAQLENAAKELIDECTRDYAALCNEHGCTPLEGNPLAFEFVITALPPNQRAGDTGSPQAVSPQAMEARARGAAVAAGYIATKSTRGRKTRDNFGGFQLVDAAHGNIVLGERFNLTPDDVIEWCRD